MDGTLIEAAASIKSFRRRDEERRPPDDDPGNPSVDFPGGLSRWAFPVGFPGGLSRWTFRWTFPVDLPGGLSRWTFPVDFPGGLSRWTFPVDFPGGLSRWTFPVDFPAVDFPGGLSRWTFPVDFHGERLRDETHESGTDPEARLMRKGKGKEAKLVFMGHALMENRNGLLLDFLVSRATGTAERDAVPVLLDDGRQRGFHPRTLGGNKGYDTRQCVKAMCDRGVTPHVARRTHSAIDGRTTRHPGYGVSQKIRKQIEEIFGWMKTVGGFRRTRYRGVERTGSAGYFVAAAYNLVRDG